MSKIRYLGYVNRNYFSRYSKDRVVDDGSTLYLEYDTPIDLSSVRYVYHTITSQDVNRITALAQRYYKNPMYWWMIAIMNGIQLALQTPPIGSQIKIPYKEDIIKIYNGVMNNG